MRYRDLLTEAQQPTLILISPVGKAEIFHSSFADFIKQRNLPHVGPLVDAGNVWCNLDANLSFINIFWKQVKPIQITTLRDVLHQLGATDTTRCEVNAGGQRIATSVGRLAPIKAPKPSKRKPSLQYLAAEAMPVEILDDDLTGNTLSRVVWEKTPIIETNDLEALSLDNHPGIYGLHVGDVEYWFHKLIDDYGNASTAWEIQITAARGDVLINDVQYAIPDESGDKADSAILLTTRRILREGKDFRYVRELVDERDNDYVP